MLLVCSSSLRLKRRRRNKKFFCFKSCLIYSSHEEVGDPAEKDALTQTAMDLLNRRGNEFRASEALEKIPTNWSLAAIYPAIEKMTQKSLHTVSVKRIMMLRQFSYHLISFTEKNSAHTEISFPECQFGRQIRAHSALKGANHSEWKQASLHRNLYKIWPLFNEGISNTTR